VDWTFFFHAWELKGRYPAILDDPEKGEVARDLFANANELLDEVAAAGSLQARGVYGFWPAHAEEDDVVLDGFRFPMLRQQSDHADSRPNRSLADYVAPAATGLPDAVGAFAVAIHGSEALADEFADALDDYRAIIVRALADRLAEAFANASTSRARGGTRRPRPFPARISSASAFAGSDPRSGTPHAPTTRRSARCSRCSTRARRASGSRSRAPPRRAPA
jgi:5-methyltetrahydrofolate--homocysteine methyltransferase